LYRLDFNPYVHLVGEKGKGMRGMLPFEPKAITGAEWENRRWAKVIRWGIRDLLKGAEYSKIEEMLADTLWRYREQIIQNHDQTLRNKGLLKESTTTNEVSENE
jgi:hypothetical protein